MKLYYYKHSDCLNFGDDLNPWLWDQLLPGFFDDDESEYLLGCGTLLNNSIDRYVPASAKKIVFGSGVGYATAVPVINGNWDFRFVRGPLSAEKLGISRSLAITDSAMLIGTIYSNTGKKKFKYSFMPHVQQAIDGGQTWKIVCGDLGINYIDPRSEVMTVLEDIACSEVLLTEAMHGAIVADSLRVPWLPVNTNKKVILDFKWHDWCASLGMQYLPSHMFTLWNTCFQLTWRQRISGQAKRTLLKHQLKKILNDKKPILSNKRTFSELTEKMLIEIDLLKKAKKSIE